jgi:hypothetical protein
MPYLSRGNLDFHTSVTRTGLHYKTTRLKKLLTALVDLQDHPSDKQKIAYLHKRMMRWRMKEPKEFAKRNSKFQELLHELIQAGATHGLALSATALTGTPAVEMVEEHDANDADAWSFVAAQLPHLRKYGEYACADAYHGTTIDKVTGPNYKMGFARLINKSQRAEVWKRYSEMKERGAGGTMPGDTNFGWSNFRAKSIHARVHAERAGICTTFAWAAAHDLTFGKTEGPRVEIVAFSNHVFVLVNRQGGLLHGTHIPDDWVREPEVIIVDAWYASLGHECVFRGIGTYGLDMVTDLQLVASWPPVEHGM